MFINFSAENAVAPKLLGRGLSISPLVVFLSFFFWSWLLGGPGMLLAMPLTVMLLFILQSYDDTRWLAVLISESKEAPQAKASPDSDQDRKAN